MTFNRALIECTAASEACLQEEIVKKLARWIELDIRLCRSSYKGFQKQERVTNSQIIKILTEQENGVELSDLLFLVCSLRTWLRSLIADPGFTTKLR